MIALSIRQPWVHAILHLSKDIENREWRTSFRGRILLHASKGCTRDEYEDAESWIAAVKLPENESVLGAYVDCRIPALADLPRGALVGAATIVDCVADYDSPWFCGPWGLVLADVVPLPRPVPCKGALGFWRVPPDVAAVVREMATTHSPPTQRDPGLPPASPGVRDGVTGGADPKTD